jgi:hypothetical protein
VVGDGRTFDEMAAERLEAATAKARPTATVENPHV